METLKNIKERRAINFFDKDRQIPEEKLKELLETANTAPSSYNLQPWEIVVVNNPDRKKALRSAAFGQPKVEDASAVFIFIANPNAVEENVDAVIKNWVDKGYVKKEDAEKSKAAPFGLYGESKSVKRQFFAVKNTAFYAMTVMIVARELGLETHPMDGFSEDMIKKEFSISEDRIIPLILAVGYPKPGLKLLPRAFRRELNEFVKFNNYK